MTPIPPSLEPDDVSWEYEGPNDVELDYFDDLRPYYTINL